MVQVGKDTNDMVNNFGDMVNGANRLSKPWILICILLVVALIATNAFWASVHYKHLKLAYENTEEYHQTQDFDSHKQEQFSNKGATFGD